MGIDQLDLILIDMYRLDEQYPPFFGKWSKEFRKMSYEQWAVDELRDFIADSIHPRTYGSIDEFISLTHKFMMKMAEYSRVRRETSQIFISASDVAASILDLLKAMK